MNKDEFFNLILDNENETQRMESLLEYRGFLFEKHDRILFLSDNAHRDDMMFLRKIVVECSLGKMVGRCIELEPQEGNFEKVIETLFPDDFSIQEDNGLEEYGWDYFKRRKHGFKTEVRKLEPYIARYVKAISACGVLLKGCCDGNHDNLNCANIQFYGKGSYEWHQFLWDEVLNARCGIGIQSSKGIFNFNGDKYKTYFKLKLAADYLYANRIVLRKLKEEALSGMKNSYLKYAPKEKVIEAFLHEASGVLAQLELSEISVEYL